MRVLLKLLLLSILIFGSISVQPLKAKPDTIQYLFMGHTRLDDRDHEYVLKTLEKIDYSKFDLLLLGGDLTWNTSGKISTLEYCDSIFNLGDATTHLSMGNHDNDNLAALLSYTKKETYYSFYKNNITFIVLNTELNTPNISGSQLGLIKSVADTIKNSDYLVIVHHRIIWMANNPDLAYFKNSVAASSSNLGSSNFFSEVYPEFQKVKSKGIPVYCIAGDRTDVNIEYSREDSIQFIASGMVGTFPDSNNFVVVFTHIPQEHLLNYAFVPLSKIDTLASSPIQTTNYSNNSTTDFRMYPNPCSDKITIQLNEHGNDAVKAEIFSPLGTKVFEVNIPSYKNAFTIDMTSLNGGIYTVRISHNHEFRTGKIIVVNNTLKK